MVLEQFHHKEGLLEVLGPEAPVWSIERFFGRLYGTQQLAHASAGDVVLGVQPRHPRVSHLDHQAAVVWLGERGDLAQGVAPWQVGVARGRWAWVDGRPLPR